MNGPFPEFTKAQVRQKDEVPSQTAGNAKGINKKVCKYLLTEASHAHKPSLQAGPDLASPFPATSNMDHFVSS